MKNNRGSLDRLLAEINEMKTDPPSDIQAEIINDNDIYNWKATMIGPDDSPYLGGIFFLNV